MKPTIGWQKKFSIFDRWALCPSQECARHNKKYAARPLGHTCMCWQKPLDDKHLDLLPHGSVLIFFGKLEFAADTIVGEGSNLRRETWLPLYSKTWILTFIWAKKNKNDFHNSLVDLDLRLRCFKISYSMLAYSYCWNLAQFFVFFEFILNFYNLKISISINPIMQHSKWVSARTPTIQLAC